MHRVHFAAGTEDEKVWACVRDRKDARALDCVSFATTVARIVAAMSPEELDDFVLRAKEAFDDHGESP
jgi:hypothetical protein